MPKTHSSHMSQRSTSSLCSLAPCSVAETESTSPSRSASHNVLCIHVAGSPLTTHRYTRFACPNPFGTGFPDHDPAPNGLSRDNGRRRFLNSISRTTCCNPERPVIVRVEQGGRTDLNPTSRLAHGHRRRFRPGADRGKTKEKGRAENAVHFVLVKVLTGTRGLP